jgi:hypothetical protein
MKTEKKIKSVSIKMSFVQCTQICISILENKYSSIEAKKEAKIELLRYATELDRIDNLTNNK